MSLRHPLANAKGTGSSGQGSHHWWLQRMSALALIPLTLWFMFSVVNHIGDDLETVRAWIAHPCVAVLLVLYLGFMMFHSQLGLQVVIEDYVHHELVKLTLIVLIKGAFLFAGVAALFAVLRIAL